MKNLFTSIILMVFTSASLFCQPPQAFSYQAVVRNNSGDIVANQAVGFQINIRTISALGLIVYQETHIVTSNDFGLANLEIGNGTPAPGMGNFDAINWGLNSKFLEVLIDPAGGTNYISMGTSELQSVPYALYSRIAANSPWELNNTDIYFNNGNVGISTASPQYRLDVWAPGTTSTGIAIFRNSLGENKAVIRQYSNGCGAMNLYNAAGEASVSLLGEGNSYFNSGNLGIGTNTPDTRLAIKTSAAGDVIKILDNTDKTVAKFRQTGNGSGALYLYDGSNNNSVFLYGLGTSFINGGSLGLGTSSVSNAKLQIEGAGTYDAIVKLNNTGANGTSFFMGSTNDAWGGGANQNLFVMGHGAPASANIDLSINSLGYLGIGTTSPNAPLHVDDRIRIGEDPSYSAVYGELIHEGAGNGFKINANAGGGWADMLLQTDGVTRVFIESGGNVGIGTTTPSSRLDVRGNMTIRDQSTGAIAVELGTGLDYAEGFNVSDKTNIKPGTVLCIDSEHPGNLKISNSSYDTKVAGIVAGANNLGTGISLGSGIHDFNVALAGRVYCNVDASSASVEVGDLLTTSSVPGFAMKVNDRDKAQGAILGKAMESLAKGEKAQILVLVTLQ